MLGTTIYTDCDTLTDWSPRQGDNVIVFAEEIDISVANNTISLTIQLYHKNLDEVGDGVGVGSPITLDGGVSKFKYTQVQGLKELVRFRLTAIGNSGGDEGYVFGWVHFRILDPTWYDSARP